MAVLTEEQSMLRDSARAWTQEKSPVSAFRKVRDSGGPLGYADFLKAWCDPAHPEHRAMKT